jgi:hypothetical protein
VFTTGSPTLKAGFELFSTTPAKSMPATIGHVRTMGEVLVSASASL